jgi:UDP-glucose 4-epimerase
VTGGAGYIGAHVVRRLVNDGHDVTVLDSLIRGRREAVADCRFIEADVRDAARLRGIFERHRFDGVVHLAALKSAEESIREPIAYYDTNVVGTLVLARAAVEAEAAWIVFSSSAAVYGAPSQLPVTELDAVDPANPYGDSKLAAERILHWVSGAAPLRWVGLRYFNAAGAGDDGELGENPQSAHNLVPLVLMAALGQRGPVEIFGRDYPTPDGTAVRDYVHVIDLAEAHANAVSHLEAGGESTILNLGTGRGSSVREVIDAAADVTGYSVPTRVVARRAGDPPEVWADPGRARIVLGWSARRDLRNILETASQWHERHPWVAK